MEIVAGQPRLVAQEVNCTFMSAFESSPVHCLKPRPSGKRRSSGNDGAAAILFTH